MTDYHFPRSSVRLAALLAMACWAFAAESQAVPRSSAAADSSLGVWTTSARTVNVGEEFYDPSDIHSETHDLPSDRNRWLQYVYAGFWDDSEPAVPLEGESEQEIEDKLARQEAWVGPHWSEGGVVVLLDTKRLERSGTTVRAWIWLAWPMDLGVDPAMELDRLLLMKEYDCSTHTVRDVERHGFRRGTAVRAFAIDEQTHRWLPESLDELMGEKVCAMDL